MDRPERRSLGIVEFLLVPLAWLGLVTLGEAAARRSGVTLPDTVTGSIFYAGWLAWTVGRASRPPVDLNVRALLGPPARRADWALLLLLAPLVVASVTALYLVMLGASFVAPGIVGEWLASPEPEAAVGTLRALPGHLLENTLGALAEELVFRGVLLSLWAQRFGVRFAVVATSVLFAAFHPDVVGSLIFAVVMAILYLRSGTLLLPIVIHMLFNMLIDVVAVVYPGGAAAVTLREFRADWWQAALGFAGAVAAIVLVLRRPRDARRRSATSGVS